MRCGGLPCGKSVWWEGGMDTWRERTVAGAATQTAPKQLLHARLPRGQGKTRAPGLSVGLAVTMRKRNSLHKTEGDAEVILADIVIATIFLKGKLHKMKYEKIQ